jgi:hypothetical protein
VWYTPELPLQLQPSALKRAIVAGDVVCTRCFTSGIFEEKKSTTPEDQQFFQGITAPASALRSYACHCGRIKLQCVCVVLHPVFLKKKIHSAKGSALFPFV